MEAVGRLGNYISQGVSSVAAPFDPFGGAVDIIVVEQEDGTFKSSPWYVKFGKFQGVLKHREKIVTVSVNGVETGFHMYLDHKGVAYFLMEQESEEEEESLLSPPSAPSSGDEASSNSAFKKDDALVCSVSSVDITSPNDKGEENNIASSLQQRAALTENGQGNQFSVVSSCSQNRKGEMNLSKVSSKKRSIFSLFRSSSKAQLEPEGTTGRERDMNDAYVDHPIHRVSSLETAERVADLLDRKWVAGNSSSKQVDEGDRAFEMSNFSRLPQDGLAKSCGVSDPCGDKTNPDHLGNYDLLPDSEKKNPSDEVCDHNEGSAMGICYTSLQVTSSRSEESVVQCQTDILKSDITTTASDLEQHSQFKEPKGCESLVVSNTCKKELKHVASLTDSTLEDMKTDNPCDKLILKNFSITADQGVKISEQLVQPDKVDDSDRGDQDENSIQHMKPDKTFRNSGSDEGRTGEPKCNLDKFDGQTGKQKCNLDKFLPNNVSDGDDDSDIWADIRAKDENSFQHMEQDETSPISGGDNSQTQEQKCDLDKILPKNVSPLEACSHVLYSRQMEAENANVCIHSKETMIKDNYKLQTSGKLDLHTPERDVVLSTLSDKRRDIKGRLRFPSESENPPNGQVHDVASHFFGVNSKKHFEITKVKASIMTSDGICTEEQAVLHTDKICAYCKNYCLNDCVEDVNTISGIRIIEEDNYRKSILAGALRNAEEKQVELPECVIAREKKVIAGLDIGEQLAYTTLDDDLLKDNTEAGRLLMAKKISICKMEEATDLSEHCERINENHLNNEAQEFFSKFPKLEVVEDVQQIGSDLVSDNCQGPGYSNMLLKKNGAGLWAENGNVQDEDLEFSFNDENVLNGSLSLSELQQQPEAGREDDYFKKNEDCDTHDEVYKEKKSSSSSVPCVCEPLFANQNRERINSDYHNENHEVEPSITETTPLKFPERSARLENNAIQEFGSLPNPRPSILDLDNTFPDFLSHSLDSNTGCLKQHIVHGILSSNSESLHEAVPEGKASQESETKRDASSTMETWAAMDAAIKIMHSAASVELSLCRHLLEEGMGADAAAQAFASHKLSLEDFTKFAPDITKNEKLVIKIDRKYFPWDAAAPIILGIAAFGHEQLVQTEGAIPVESVKKQFGRCTSDSVANSGGGWNFWRLPFSRSVAPERSKSSPLTPNEKLIHGIERSSESPISSSLILKNVSYKRAGKWRMRVKIPTSEQLASLNLKEGQNTVTFTFSTRVFGRQQVDARIYLWRWNTKIVVSDVDGTITKSDVLGQFMPLVGKDWTQSGVAHLFSAIKENGYQLLFLSARAIGQAYLTRQFLVNVKQDGKSLPDGPVVMSPDGLFPSLYREVIRRTPHEFKISCLEKIKALFPSDCNPFYAGFGNRDTDEISYLRVGIPKGKIFIINPKGEIAVNHHVVTKSYASLHELVNGMFPAMSSIEQEDFNSWNYWRMPLPEIGN